MRIAKVVSVVVFALIVITSCKKDEDQTSGPTPSETGPRLKIKFRFDSTQVRLNAFGLDAPILDGHGAQSPVFNRMSAHYVEFAPTAFTPLGSGDVVYQAPQTTIGGSLAIDHAAGNSVGDGEVFLDLPLSSLAPGVYDWLRVSLAYQNYTVKLSSAGLPFTGTVASFIGFNTYITSFPVADSIVTVNANKLQGYWAFEVNDPPIPLPVSQGQAPGTTVVNPLSVSSPIPPGSCVVTGNFAVPVIVTGDETQDKVIIVSLSTNKSFEWTETDGDNIFEPLDGETVVDMGIRGMIPWVQ